MGRKLQLQKLQIELESSESQISILRYKMEAHEHARVEMEEGENNRIVRNDDKSNVGRVEIGQNEQEQYEQLQLLEREKQSAMDKFHNTL